MAALWQIHDLMDLEYLLRLRADADNGRDAAGDRRIYLEYVSRHPQTADRRSVLKHWLQTRRKSQTADANQEIMPGRVYAQAMRMAGWIIFFAAFFAGAALAGSLLSYGGTTPVNVFTCLWVLLFPQILLLALLAAASVLSHIRPSFRKNGLYFLISALLRRLALRLMGWIAPRLSRQQQNRFQEVVGMVGRSRTVYGNIFFWPVFNTAQLAGIAFNFGVLAAMLMRITLTDVAFGWQSTLRPDPQTVYAIVEFLAAPWAWFLEPPVAHPTAAQIAGSKMVLKEGIYDLASGDLASWWPFLCFSVLFYGLMPRVVLLGLGGWQQRRQLVRLNFTHAACDRLWLQMTAPKVETRSTQTDMQDPAATEKPGPGPDKAQHNTHSPPPGSGQSVVLIVPEDAGMDISAIAEKIRSQTGLETAAGISATGDPDQDVEQLTRALENETMNQVRVAVVIEAWQPPIRENLAWIRRIRNAAGPTASLMLFLTGKPGKSGGLPGAPDKTGQATWQQAVNGLADPYIRTEILGRSD
ncbi:MAG: DUF2868 domain-containing protein [Desulfosalsimonas sp.]|uniref:DUF2868 domain-containing protein n=1 Tax=Desulfosalsimonas sp. TaxID=3073848 RepID=UPI003971054B